MIKIIIIIYKSFISIIIKKYVRNINFNVYFAKKDFKSIILR